ncbi:MAG: hypothetical protein NTW29_06390 [Bacteroidetes bacterium]|nr:hypothetical protein [Bacteroidota bacterium]
MQSAGISRIFSKAIFILVLLVMASHAFGQYIPPYEQNPKFNSSINPKFTTAINPKFTPAINPLFTSAINPRFSTDINPKYTSTINPKFNYELNPKFNSRINPTFSFEYNPAYGGRVSYYMYNYDADLIGLLIQVNEQVMLYFSKAGDWIGYFIKAKDNYNLFDLEGEWTGRYLCSDSNNGYNLFNENGDWSTNYVK